MLWASLLLALAGCGDAPAADDPGDPEPDEPVRLTAYVKASNPGAHDVFGRGIALSADGSTLAVGAPEEDSEAIGVGGDPNRNLATNAGAVYVLVRRGDTWIRQAYIKASNTGESDAFGWSVSLSADGSTLAVGAPGEDSAATGIGGDQGSESMSDAGAVYVFTRSGSAWSQEAYVKASNPGPSDYFGASVALSADGAVLAVGASGEDSAATGINGNQVSNAAGGSGAVYVFTRNGTWDQQAYVKASNTGANDELGARVALSADGSVLAVGAHRERSAATGIDGEQADDSAPDAGAVYVFARSGATWSQEAYVKASNTDASDHFGWSIALAGDGATLAVGTYAEDSAATGVGGSQADNSAAEAGAVYVFARGDATWAQEAYVKASNTGAIDVFGASVALSADGSILVVGASGEDSAATGMGGDPADNSAGEAGAAYVFTRTEGTWSQRSYVKASNTEAGDGLGEGIALSGDGATLAVNAPYEDGSAAGVDGDQADNYAPGAGAVYLFY